MVVVMGKHAALSLGAALSAEPWRRCRDMAYSWSIDTEEHSPTRNRAQAPMPFLVPGNPESIPEIYTKRFGVPLDKLGILLPWWGTSFHCKGSATGACVPTPLSHHRFFLCSRLSSLRLFRHHDSNDSFQSDESGTGMAAAQRRRRR